MIITIYDNCYSDIPSRYSTFEDLFRTLMTEKEYLDQARMLSELSSSDPDSYAKAKKTLGVFSTGKFSKRGNDYIEEYEGFIIFEIDNCSNPESALARIGQWEYTRYAFPSPSGNGIRVVVSTDSNISNRPAYFEAIASELSKFTGIPLREQDKSAAYVDTVAKDLTRLWYFTGVERSKFKGDKRSKVWSMSGNLPVKKPVGATSHRKLTDYERALLYVEEVERRGIDVTAEYDDWVEIGLSLASMLGEDGRDLFHRLGSKHEDYNQADSDKKYTGLLNTPNKRVSGGKFFYKMDTFGVNVDFSSHSMSDSVVPVREVRIKSDPDMEKKLAGYLCRNGKYDELILKVRGISPSIFTGNHASRVVECVEKMSISGKYYDLLILKSMAGDDAFREIEDYVINPCSEEEAESYALRLIDIHKRSEYARIFSDAAKGIPSHDGSIDDYVSGVSSMMDSVSMSSKNDDDSIESAVDDFRGFRFEVFHKMADDPDAILGLPTGTMAEDKFSWGRMPGNLVIIAARPGMGKSAKMLQEARVCANAGFPVGIISLEVPKNEIVQRLIGQTTGLKKQSLYIPDVHSGEDRIIEQTEDSIKNLPIWINTSCRDILSIKSKARAWVKNNNVAEIFIDHIGLVSYPSKFGNRNEGVGYVTAQLKQLSLELNIPVTALCQLSRAVEVRGGSKRPALSDLRESGRIEEDADVVAFLYRPGYYGIDEDENGRPLKNIAEVIYAKNRNGDLGTVINRWHGETFTFDDVDDDDEIFSSSPVRQTKKSSYEQTIEKMRKKHEAEIAAEGDLISSNRPSDDDIPF